MVNNKCASGRFLSAPLGLSFQSQQMNYCTYGGLLEEGGHLMHHLE